jgi:hypothetical protein
MTPTKWQPGWNPEPPHLSWWLGCLMLVLAALVLLVVTLAGIVKL